MQSLFRHLSFFSALVLSASVFAQDAADAPDAPADAPAINTESFYGKESTQGVYVRDSAVALEKFPLATKLERLKEWGKAADVLQEVLEKYPDRVIQNATDAEGQIVRYTSVATAVQQQIAKWPAEGLAAYRARFEAPAQVLLEGAEGESVETLRQVYSVYFNTESGKRAGLRLIDLAFRAGDFRAAADVAAELLAWHPSLEEERPGVLFRAALTHHLAGDSAKAQTYADELAKTAPQASATLRGQEAVLAKALADELKHAPAAQRDLSPDHWPIFGGDDTRSRVSAGQGRTGARLFRVPLSPRITFAVNNDMRIQLEATDEHIRSQGAYIGVIPVTDRGELFFQDGKAIFGVSLESGLPLPGWAATHGGDAAGAYVDPETIASPTGQQHTVTVTDNEVLAVMGLPERQNPYGGQTSASANRIVCLDRTTGRVKWLVQPKDLPEEGGALRDLVFTGSPLVIGDSVHLIGRGGKSAQFEDCYVITLSLADGKHKWSTYIASANSDQMNMMGGGRGSGVISPESTAHIAHASGRLFVLTNLGAVAALDAYNGTIRWLSIYERNVETDFRGMRRGMRARPPEMPRPWTFNPVIAEDGLIFVLPSDSDHLLIYDAFTGDLGKRISKEHVGDADTLVGVAGDRLVVASEFRVTCLSHSRYDPATYRADNYDVLYWFRDLPDAGEATNPIRGRSFLTSDSVFVPSQRGLLRVDLNKGRIVEQYPSEQQGAAWGDGEGPGNVLVTADRVVVAGDRAINVYTDLAVAQAKLDAEVAAAPQDAGPRLRYAEVMFVAGQTDLALAKLDEAIELLGGAQRMRSGPERDRLFTAALNFAEKAASTKTSPGLELARALFDRAGVAAASAAHQVNYRFSRARFAAAQDDPQTVLRLQQEILLDPALRQVTIRDARWGGATPAGVVAEREIGQLIRAHGAGLYEKYEQAARAAMDAARQAGDAQVLIEIGRQYPNAAAAPEALLVAADLQEQAKDHRRATQTLRQLVARHGQAIDRSQVIELMARNYLAMERVDVALSRLSSGARADAKAALKQPLRLPDGEAIAAGTSFADAARRLGDYRADAKPQIATFALPPGEWSRANLGKSPFDEATSFVLPGVRAIVPAQEQHSRHGQVVLWMSDGSVAIHEAGSAEPRGRISTITDTPREWAQVEAGMVLRTSGQLLLIDPQTAAVKWAVRLDGLPDAELVAQTGETREAPEAVRLPVGQAEPIVLRGQVRMVNNRPVMPQQLVPAPQRVPGPEAFVQMRVTADRVLATTTTGRLVAIDLASGKLAWQTRLLEDLPLERMLANDDFAVVRVISPSSIQLVVFDTMGGEQLSRRSFSPEGGQVPVNFDLAADGTLVYVLPDRLCGKDLYDPSDALNWEVHGQAPGKRVFIGATQPDHLQIQGNRILILSDEGQFVRVHSLETGKMLRRPSGQAGQEINTLLSTGAKGWDVRLLTSGSHLYVVSPLSVVAYDLDHPEHVWNATLDDRPHNFRQAMVGTDFVVLFESLAAAGTDVNVASTMHRIHAHSREKTSKGESGILRYNTVIRNPAGIETWMGVNGGFYYLASDRALHFLSPVEPKR